MASFDVESLIDQSTPLVRRLPPHHRVRLSYLVDLFLQDVEFEGGDSFKVTPRMAVTIATHACLMLVRRRTDRFGGRIRIVVHERGIHGDRETMGLYHRSGEIHLSWDDVIRGGFISDDGSNVVIHEFAHRLDGPLFLDGMPSLGSILDHIDWNTVMNEEFRAFREALERGELTPLDPYAATNPAEFFACTTEALFEQPDMLREHYPRVFERLVRFYGDGEA